MALADDSSTTAGDARTQRLPWQRRVIAPATGQLTLVGHLILAGTLLLGSLAVNAWMFAYATGQQNDWLNLSNLARTPEANRAAVANVQATAAERDRMVEQLTQVHARLTTHAAVMGLFYKLNFIALGTIGLSAGVASVTIFFISKAGWERVNNALIHLFIVASGLIIFHSNLILIYKFEDNIRLNAQLYSEYTRLYNAILTYWAIQPTAAQSPTPADFILATDQRLGDLGTITLDFDASRIVPRENPLDALDYRAQPQ